LNYEEKQIEAAHRDRAVGEWAMRDSMEDGTISGQQRIEVSFDEILDARDRRAERQAYLSASHHTPILSFTLNMPGNVKRTPLSSFFFDDRLMRFKAQLRAMGAVIVEELVFSERTGDEALLAVSNLSSRSLKELAIAMEERSIAGRLLDLDVLDEESAPVKRASIGAVPRRCLLCEQPASVCSSSRAHSPDELRDKVTHMLEQAVFDVLVDDIVAMASKASSFELMVSLKPGLVTYSDSGSHSDMDRFTFAKSQASILSYYKDAFLAGWENIEDEMSFFNLRLKGMKAERRMFQATGGINTHRGWIYITGILAAAVGLIGASVLRGNGCLRSGGGTPTEKCSDKAVALLSDTVSSIARALEGSLESPLFENVRRNMADHSVYTSPRAKRTLSHSHLRGIREEAISGFPSIFHVGLPLLSQSLKCGEGEDLAGQRTVLALLVSTEDTTLGKRGGEFAVTNVRQRILTALGLESEPTCEELVRSVLDLTVEDLHEHLRALSEYFFEFRLSCGGVADLLAGSFLTLDLCLVTEKILVYR
jgi:holo-ACP synthase/triphosphoribosyl-dephospho-CoA synthase